MGAEQHGLVGFRTTVLLERNYTGTDISTTADDCNLFYLPKTVRVGLTSSSFCTHVTAMGRDLFKLCLVPDVRLVATSIGSATAVYGSGSVCKGSCGA